MTRTMAPSGAAPGSPGLLPLDPDRVSRVVGHLGVEATTELALRVLTQG